MNVKLAEAPIALRDSGLMSLPGTPKQTVLRDVEMVLIVVYNVFTLLQQRFIHLGDFVRLTLV